jgi:hypothetical protein
MLNRRFVAAIAARSRVRATGFYAKVFGFAVIADFGERGCAMQAGRNQVLLMPKYASE